MRSCAKVAKSRYRARRLDGTRSIDDTYSPRVASHPPSRPAGPQTVGDLPAADGGVSPVVGYPSLSLGML
ncbi:MAG: hypothetical protein J4F38_12735, partial [Pseudomonadales bacterium]|nr:hypothetical protein [Pseudomonadales bacterium]